jgi:hypothetical protein
MLNKTAAIWRLLLIELAIANPSPLTGRSQALICGESILKSKSESNKEILTKQNNHRNICEETESKPEVIL